jgi:23S rRNA pseudouridine2457 synthase
MRREIPTCWIEIVVREGRNRQVRHITAAVGHPTLRLLLYAIGNWRLDGLLPGDTRSVSVQINSADPSTGCG